MTWLTLVNNNCHKLSKVMTFQPASHAAVASASAPQPEDNSNAHLNRSIVSALLSFSDENIELSDLFERIGKTDPLAIISELINQLSADPLIRVTIEHHSSGYCQQEEEPTFLVQIAPHFAGLAHIRQQCSEWRNDMFNHMLNVSGNGIALSMLNSAVPRPQELPQSVRMKHVVLMDPLKRFRVSKDNEVFVMSNEAGVLLLQEVWRLGIINCLFNSAKFKRTIRPIHELGAFVRKPRCLPTKPNLKEILQSDPYKRFRLSGDGVLVASLAQGYSKQKFAAHLHLLESSAESVFNISVSIKSIFDSPASLGDTSLILCAGDGENAKELSADDRLAGWIQVASRKQQQQHTEGFAQFASTAKPVSELMSARNHDATATNLTLPFGASHSSSQVVTKSAYTDNFAPPGLGMGIVLYNRDNGSCPLSVSSNGVGSGAWLSQGSTDYSSFSSSNRLLSLQADRVDRELDYFKPPSSSLWDKAEFEVPASSSPLLALANSDSANTKGVATVAVTPATPSVVPVLQAHIRRASEAPTIASIGASSMIPVVVNAASGAEATFQAIFSILIDPVKAKSQEDHRAVMLYLQNGGCENWEFIEFFEENDFKVVCSHIKDFPARKILKLANIV